MNRRRFLRFERRGYIRPNSRSYFLLHWIHSLNVNKLVREGVQLGAMENFIEIILAKSWKII